MARVISLVSRAPHELLEKMQRGLRRKVDAGRLTHERAQEMEDGFRVALAGYTYLEE